MINRRKKIHKELLKLADYVSGQNISSINAYQEPGANNIKTSLLNYDYSKQRITPDVINTLLEIPDQLDIKDSLSKLIDGSFDNVSEKRNVSHTIYRSPSNVEGFESIFKERKKIEIFLKELRSKANINNIICLSIGGSRLGPEFLCEFQSSFAEKKVYFCSSLDLIELKEALSLCKQEDTVVLVSSKSFKTSEILKNFDYVRLWFDENPEIKFSQQVYGISSDYEEMTRQGIPKTNQFRILDSLGGRFSVWSSISLPAFVNASFDDYMSFLDGAYLADQYTLTSPWNENISVMMALFAVWNSTSLKINNHGIFTYNYRLRSLPKYISQLSMESNGKTVNFLNEKSFFPTSPLIWGGYGIDAQHSTFQWLMQGKTATSCDFIGVNQELKDHLDSHNMLLAQVLAMSYGEVDDVSHFKSVKGNNPCSIILLNSLDYRSLGFLIALYEHKTFIESLILGIDPFDQWGVELGKKLASRSEHNQNFFSKFFARDILPKN